MDKSDMSKEQEVRLDAEDSNCDNDSTQESAAIESNKSCEGYEKKVKEIAEAGIERVEDSDEDKDRDKECRKPSLIELEKELLENAIFIVRNGLVYYYDEAAHYYRLVDEDDVIEIFRSSVNFELYNTSNLRVYNELYRFLKTDPLLKWDRELKGSYCNLKNGIYFLKNEELVEHDSNYITFTCLNASYDEYAECPTFKKFVEDITGGRKDLKNRLLMALGYLLVETRKGKFFFVAGYLPNTGKSVLLNFIQRLYPPEAVSNLPVGDLGGRFESEVLLNARINISSDLPQDPLSTSAVAKLKQITGGDTVQIQRKNRVSKKLDHPVKLVFASNHPIMLKYDDEAFWNRLIYLPFNNRVMKEDPKLGKKLWKERDGIVTFLLKAAKKLDDLDYKFPPIEDDVRRGTVQKRPVDYISDFIEDCCDIEDCSAICPIADLKDRYENYCQRNMLPLCRSRKKFNDFMESKGIFRAKKYVNKTQVWVFLGIRLKREKRLDFLELANSLDE